MCGIVGIGNLVAGNQIDRTTLERMCDAIQHRGHDDVEIHVGDGVGDPHAVVPNKVFDYKMHQKPILVSHARALRDIVERSGCGVHCQDDDHKALARALIVLQAEQGRAELGEASQRALEAQYFWSVDERILIDAIIQVAGEVKV